MTVRLLPTLPPFRGVLLFVWGVTPCGAVKSALRLPLSFWHCLCLAILFIYLNLARSSPYSAGDIRKALPMLLSYPTVGAIYEAHVFVVRKSWSRQNLPQGCVPPLLLHLVVIVLFAYVHYLVVLPFHACLKENSDIKWTKTLYQNNLNNIAFFFTFFKGYRCN